MQISNLLTLTQVTIPTGSCLGSILKHAMKGEGSLPGWLATFFNRSEWEIKKVKGSGMYLIILSKQEKLVDFLSLLKKNGPMFECLADILLGATESDKFTPQGEQSNPIVFVAL